MANDQVTKIQHPWGLIWTKLTYFPLLEIANWILMPRYFRGVSQKLKKVLFYDRFAAFTKKKFYKGLVRGMAGKDVKTYGIGPLLICLAHDEKIPTAALEWNLSREYLDIVYPIENPKHFRFILAEGPYELGENIVLEKGDYVVDAGASLGVFSFLAANRVGNDGHVFAIEPVDFLCKCLKESIHMNKFENVTVLPVALGAENGSGSMNIDYEDPSSSRLGGISREISVNLKTLDKLVFEEKIVRRVNFIKMDIEGSEREALLGARETISRFKPKLSICAYHRKDDFEVLSNIIRDIEPRYNLIYGKRKIYGYVD